MVVPYPGRPQGSPVLATCLAAGLILPSHRVLDLGCGTGGDALALARWGCRDVHGVDASAHAVGVARRRARRAGVERRVRFVHGDVYELSTMFPPGRFHCVLDTLLLNNLADEATYAREVAAVTAREGLLVLQFRITAKAFAQRRPESLPEVGRYFRLGPPALALVPEDPRRFAWPFARVMVQLGRRTRRPV